MTTGVLVWMRKRLTCSNRPDLGDQAGEVAVVEHEWVTAGEDQLGDARILADGVERREVRALPVGSVREVPAEAVATIDRAGAAGDEQGTPGVLLHQSGIDDCLRFAKCVVVEPGHGLGFQVARQHLP